MAYVIAIVVSFLIALIVCSVLKSGMKNVAQKAEANAYSGGLALTGQRDRYTHTTRVRTKIPTNSKK